MKFILLTLFCLNSFANLMKFEVGDPLKINFSFEQVCLENKHQASLIEVKNSTAITCMGEEVVIDEFCLKKYKNDSDYARGYIDSKNKQIICEKAKTIALQFKCSKNSQGAYCRDSKSGCQAMKKILAHNLDILHHSLIERDDETKDLNCYFENDLALNL